jgi:3-oxoacyl-[acyl-carrier-protein] synthase-3
MKYGRVHVDAIGYELAPVVVTSDELEERLARAYNALRIRAGQLEALTGIAERRWWDRNHRLSDGAAAAGSKALAKSSVDPREVQVLIYAGVNREHFEPATACRVASLIGVSPHAAVYDLSNACLGVLNGMLEIANRIELGQIRAGMVVSCETAREINDIVIDQLNAEPTMECFAECLATFTGGSGAVAVVLTDGSFGVQTHTLRGGVTEVAPEHHNLCRWGIRPGGLGNAFTQFMTTDAVSVLKHGVDLGIRTWKAFLTELGWRNDEIDKVICHQVGSSHQQTILNAIGIPRDKDFPTYPFLGNIGTVSLPLTAAIAEERGFLRPGDRVGFLGIGSGLNCLMLGLEW